MLRTRWPHLLIYLLLNSAWLAQASDWQNTESLRAAAVHWVQAQSSTTARVEAKTLDPRLKLPACTSPLTIAGDPTATRSTWSVAVSCIAANGTPQWSVHVPVTVRELRPVVVLARAVPAGQPLTAQDVQLVERDLSTLGFGYLDSIDAVRGQILRRPFAAGSVLTPDAVAAVKLIRRGALVTLLSEAGGLSVQSQGRALQDGAAGERIPVENASSRRVVQGVVKDSGTVEVSL